MYDLGFQGSGVGFRDFRLYGLGFSASWYQGVGLVLAFRVYGLGYRA